MSVNRFPRIAFTISLAMPPKKSEPSVFGRRLEALRKARDLSQLQVARALGTTQRSVSLLRNPGRFSARSCDRCPGQALRVSADELLGLPRRPNTGSKIRKSTNSGRDFSGWPFARTRPARPHPLD